MPKTVEIRNYADAVQMVCYVLTSNDRSEAISTIYSVGSLRHFRAGSRNFLESSNFRRNFQEFASKVSRNFRRNLYYFPKQISKNFHGDFQCHYSTFGNFPELFPKNINLTEIFQHESRIFLKHKYSAPFSTAFPPFRWTFHVRRAVPAIPAHSTKHFH